MHLLPGRRSQWEAATPVSFRHCQRQWPLVAVPSGHAPAICKGGRDLWTVFTALVRPWHSRRLVSGPKRGIRTCTSRQKKKTRESVSWSHVALKAPKGKCFFKLAIGQNLQNEGRALFLCIYPYYICTDFFFPWYLKWRRILTSGMSEKRRHYFVGSNCLGVWGFEKKIIKV